jgi:hypothetical protein
MKVASDTLGTNSGNKWRGSDSSKGAPPNVSLGGPARRQHRLFDGTCDLE